MQSNGNCNNANLLEALIDFDEKLGVDIITLDGIYKYIAGKLDFIEAPNQVRKFFRRGIERLGFDRQTVIDYINNNYDFRLLIEIKGTFSSDDYDKIFRSM